MKAKFFSGMGYGVKRCSKCGLAKDESEFHKNKRRKDGLQDWCKKCKLVLQRKYRETPKGKEVMRTDQEKRDKAQPEKHRARSTLYYHLKMGHIKKKPCFCGETNAQGHHEDYNKPLNAEWLCKKHHID